MADVILIIFVLAGVIGTFVPFLPGCGIILVGAIIHGAMTEFTPLNLTTLMLLAGLCLISQAGSYLLSGLGSQKLGASKYGITGGIAGLVTGIFIPVPAGIFIGAFLGAFLFELVFAMREIKAGVRAGLGAILGVISSFFFEFFIGLVMAGVIIMKVFVR